MSRLLLLAALVSAASAAPVAHYSPDGVAKLSVAFGKASEVMGPAFEERDGKLRAIGSALQDLEVGTGMLGADAPAEARAWYESTRRQAVGEALRLQKHADLLQEDYGRVFGAALERALPAAAKGVDLKECAPTGVAAMIGRSNCPGEDRNPAIAAAIDADAALAKELADIATVEWPAVSTPRTTLAAVPMTGGDRWVSGPALAARFVGRRVASARADAEATAEAALEKAGGAPEAAKAARTAWDQTLAADGAALRALVVAALQRGAKKGGPAGVAWCPNPAALGGCAGEDATKAVLAALETDKRFMKDLTAGLPAPE